MQEQLRKKVEIAAKSRGVSLNEEIVSRLDRTFMEAELSARIEHRFASLESSLSKAMMMIPMTDEERLQYSLAETRRISDRIDAKRKQDRPPDLGSSEDVTGLAKGRTK